MRIPRADGAAAKREQEKIRKMTISQMQKGVRFAVGAQRVTNESVKVNRNTKDEQSDTKFERKLGL